MRLFVLRHGRAEPYKTDDASRALIRSGEADLRSVLDNQRALVGQPAQIWHSGYLRARQSAAIAADVLGYTDAPHVSEQLVPEAHPAALIEALYHRGLDSLLLVSHQPLVTHLLDRLCGPAGPEAHHMPTASLACVELDVVAADLGHLAWLARP